jgi:hypothetical protein
MIPLEVLFKAIERKSVVVGAKSHCIVDWQLQKVIIILALLTGSC